MSSSTLYYLHCLTPVHVGAGQGVGAIDLPIMRERITEWPLVPGSGLKGVHKDHFDGAPGKDAGWMAAAFGKAGDQDGNAGALVWSDSRMLAFPVASRYGTFAYVTCPLAIKRLMRDAAAAGIATRDPGVAEMEAIFKKQGDAAYAGTEATVKSPDGKCIVLDEFNFKTASAPGSAFVEWVNDLAGQLFADGLSRSMWKERLVVVSDETFLYFVSMCCEVTPRIRIDSEKKTVEGGALWYEEYLPAESILYGLVWCDKIHVPGSKLTPVALLDTLRGERILQIGGNASVGKGRVRCSVTGGGRP